MPIWEIRVKIVYHDGGTTQVIHNDIYDEGAWVTKQVTQPGLYEVFFYVDCNRDEDLERNIPYQQYGHADVVSEVAHVRVYQQQRVFLADGYGPDDDMLAGTNTAGGWQGVISGSNREVWMGWLAKNSVTHPKKWKKHSGLYYTMIGRNHRVFSIVLVNSATLFRTILCEDNAYVLFEGHSNHGKGLLFSAGGQFIGGTRGTWPQDMTYRTFILHTCESWKHYGSQLRPARPVGQGVEVVTLDRTTFKDVFIAMELLAWLDYQETPAFGTAWTQADLVGLFDNKLIPALNKYYKKWKPLPETRRPPAEYGWFWRNDPPFPWEQ